ncbi:hypothetical protein [Telluribacter humicola]|uniref:hypothetical protein n=1 Tax=Telluribacter humicola TaxID=1720261 RepID=UPI001A97CAF9|nr:hypothetical protein [Telluribacter humicola]
MFYAYPNHPSSVGATIEATIEELKKLDINIASWKELNITGNFIRDKVLESIDLNSIFIADISTLNENVTFEIGYAIGKQKTVILTKNKSINDSNLSIKEVGIFDTIGFL